MVKLSLCLVVMCTLIIYSLALCVPDASANTKLSKQMSSLSLIQAAKQGNLEAERTALNAGADPNFIDNSGTTALEYAGLRGNIITAIEADPKSHPERRFDLIKELVDHKAKVKEVKDPNFADSIVQAALTFQRYDVAQLFLAQGAGQEKFNFWFLLDLGQPRRINPDPLQRRLFETLLAQTKNPTELSQVLFAAVRASDSAYFTRRLLDKGANPNARNYNGTTPLIEAIRHQKVDVVIALLQGGANPSLPYVYVTPPLGYHQNSWEEANGRTPLSFAVAEGNQPLIRLLKRANAKP